MSSRLYAQEADFEARIRILTEVEGGRKTPPFNGIRWDFRYADDAPGAEIFMIYPDFFDDEGESLPPDEQISGTRNARMHIVVKEMIPRVHQNRIGVGTKFYCVEGARAVAEGEVTKLVGITNYYED